MDPADGNPAFLGHLGGGPAGQQVLLEHPQVAPADLAGLAELIEAGPEALLPFDAGPDLLRPGPIVTDTLTVLFWSAGGHRPNRTIVGCGNAAMRMKPDRSG